MVIEFLKVVGRSSLAFLMAATVDMSVIPAHAGEQIFDELRFGASASLQGGGEHEDGIFPK